MTEDPIMNYPLSPTNDDLPPGNSSSSSTSTGQGGRPDIGSVNALARPRPTMQVGAREMDFGIKKNNNMEGFNSTDAGVVDLRRRMFDGFNRR